MSYTEKLAGRLALLATIDPQLLHDSMRVSHWIDLLKGRRVLFVVSVGAIDGTGMLRLQMATDATGANAQDIPRTIHQLTAYQSNRQFILEAAFEELPASFSHVAVAITMDAEATGGYVSAVAFSAVSLYPRLHHLASVLNGTS